MYFWLLIIVVIPSYLLQGFGHVWDFVDVAIFLMTMVGFFAFCWKKKIFNRLFWKGFFVVCVSWSLIYQYFLPLPPHVAELNFGGLPRHVLATLALVFFIPLAIAIYRYAFRQDGIWKAQ